MTPTALAPIQDQGATPNIPPKSNRRWKPCFSKRLYRVRNLRFFSKLKHFRRVATRYNSSPPTSRHHPAYVNAAVAASLSVYGLAAGTPNRLVLLPAAAFERISGIIMLNISREVFGGFQDQASARFRRELMAHLRELQPGFASIDDALLDHQIAELIVLARTFSIRTRTGISAYVLTAGHLGLDFCDRFPPARQILEAHEDEETRINRLERFVSGLFAALAL